MTLPLEDFYLVDGTISLQPLTLDHVQGLADVAEIGYTWFAQSAQQTACNRRVKLLLLSHAFEQWQVHRISLRTDARNLRSRRAIAGLGASFEDVRRADRSGQDGRVRGSAFFSIVLSE